MSEKPFILLSNDDGIYAKGIKHLWTALHENYELAIVAPHREKSGTSLATSLLRPIHVFDVAWEKNTPAWKVTGTPTDSVKMALSVLLDKKPDLVVSGINKGSNAGRSALYSGTVACVIEATLRGIPGIAFSCFEYENPIYEDAVKYVTKIVAYFLKNPLPKGTLLNVTFPPKGLPIKGMKMTRQGKARWMETPNKRKHPEGHYYFWLELAHEDLDEKDNDTSYLKEGYITAVPIKIDELTNHEFLQKQKQHFETFFEKI